MRSSTTIFQLLVLGFALLVAACSQEEGLATDPMEDLRFSTDSVSFDTVFSGLNTPTVWLKIYNTGSRTIRISDVFLQSAGKKGFCINLDGISATTYSNVDVPAKDSLFLFVKLEPIARGLDSTFLLEDALVFRSQGKQKQISLKAFSRDVVLWRGKTIASDTVLTSGKPFLIYDSLVVAKGVKLEIKEGVAFYLHDGAKVTVRGCVKAKGSLSAPIVFRGDRLDQILPDLSYDDYPGQWGALRLTASSFENEFDYVHIRGCVSGIVADSSSLGNVKLTLTNSIVHNATQFGLWSCNNVISVANTQWSNCGQNVLFLKGGKYDFTHCTIANYLYLVRRKAASLMLSNHQNPNLTYPLQAEFFNCIIFGSQSNEIDTLHSAQAAWKLQFVNCLLRSPVWPSDVAKSCLYGVDPNFRKLGSSAEKYRFDFRLKSESEARNRADSTYSKKYSTDRNGVSRLTDSAPDIGAYEYL